MEALLLSGWCYVFSSDDPIFPRNETPIQDSYIRYNIEGKFEIYSKYVQPITSIHVGENSIICQAMNSETQEMVAIKRNRLLQRTIRKSRDESDARISAKRTLREIRLLRHMHHDNVITITDIIRPAEKTKFNEVYIVYKLMDTDLRQKIKSNQELKDNHCRYILYQLLCGLKYLHSANVLHQDLQPRNLLLNVDRELKIAGFDFARTTAEGGLMSRFVADWWYQAPELLLNCTEYTTAIDIWSVGCILVEIMSGLPLFCGKDIVVQLQLISKLIGAPHDSSLGFLPSDDARRFVRHVTRPLYEAHAESSQNIAERFPNLSSDAADLVEKMLVFDPNQRITADAALRHPYFEPVCSAPFSFQMEPTLTEEEMKELIVTESEHFDA